MPTGELSKYGLQALDQNWFDHAPPQTDEEADWFLAQCLYAVIISSASEMLYSQRALRQLPPEREQNLRTTLELLDSWRSRLPARLREIHKPDVPPILDDHHTRDIALRMFRQYHETIFMAYFPWTSGQSNVKISEHWQQRSMELCTNSAQAVLAMANQILCLDVLDK